jgi:hypothetical protein
MSFLLTQYGVALEIDVTPFGTARTWTNVCDGFNNFSEALNDQVQEYFFLCGKCFGTSEVTGIHPTFTLSGVRKIGDPAQDFIFAQRYNLMQGRHTNIRYSIMDGAGTVTRYTVPVTMTNMQAFGGATTDGSAVSVDFAFNGRPLVETVAASSELTVSSVAGTLSGTTVLTVVPTYPDAGCKFVYAWADTAPTATAGETLTSWNDFTNGATYQIPSGKNVTVAMVNVSTYVVVGSGSAAVVSAE